MPFRWMYVVGVLFAAALAPAALAQFDLSWNTIDGGGATFSTGGGFELGGTIGQPDASLTPMTGGSFVVVGGFWAGVPAGCRGEMNCDGAINFADIDPFVAVLGGGPCCDPTGYNCDVNGDGAVNFADIDPFVALLSSGATCP